MYGHVEKVKEIKNKAVDNSVTKKKRGMEKSSGLVDNISSIVTNSVAQRNVMQRKLQLMAYSIPKIKQATVVQRRLGVGELKRVVKTLSYNPDIVPLATAARYVWVFLGERVGTNENVGQVLTEMGYGYQEDILSEILERVRRQLSKKEEVQEIETDEMRASRITSTDNTGRVIGPFNGGRGGREEVPPSQGAVYYDESRDYCISVDNSEHAGAGTWKLFAKGGGRWQRIDTLYPDGRRMYRG